jgi:hypothetical protein
MGRAGRWSLAVLTLANLVVLISKDTSSSLKLRNEDGREQTVKP